MPFYLGREGMEGKRVAEKPSLGIPTVLDSVGLPLPLATRVEPCQGTRPRP